MTANDNYVFIMCNNLCYLGTKVIEVRATDADDPTTANGELKYSLTSAGDTSAFEIDSHTGRVPGMTSTLTSTLQQHFSLPQLFIKINLVKLETRRLFLLEHESELNS